MLYLVLAFPIISAICLWTGWLFYQLLPIPAPTSAAHIPVSPILSLTSPIPSALSTTPYTRPLILYLLTGLMLLTGIGQCIILFAPLKPAALLLILPVLAILTPFRRNNAPPFPNILEGIPPKKRGLFITAGCSLLLMIITLNAGPTVMDDTDSYHIQMVKWIQEYGTVPGIANLHLRFGFNSSWFTAIGLLSPRIDGIGHFLVLNGLLSCWFCHYLLQKIFTARSPLAFAFLLITGLLVWPMIRGNAASANYDFISTICILVLLSESIAPRHPLLWPEWALWPFFLFTVRIINAPLLLFSVLTGISYFRLYKKFPWAALTAAAFFVLPFLARNVLLSGYPLLPFYQIDFFSVDWKADKQELIQITEFIKYFNRSNGDLEKVRGASFPIWLPTWFRQLFVHDRILISLALFTWAWIILQWKKGPGRCPPILKGLIFTLAISIPCWLLTAPDPRFLYGPLLAGPFLFLVLFPISSRPLAFFSPPRLVTAFLACLSISTFAYTARKIQVNPDYRNPVTPHPLPVPVFAQIQVDGITLHIPNKILNNWNPRCYDLPLPCLYRINPRLHCRGKEIGDGFRLEGPVRGTNPLLPVGPDNPAEDNGEFKFE